MSKKVVVITGSPRRRGNTMAMADAFCAAAEAKGYEVTRFDATRLEVKGCLACNSCYKHGPCAAGDDFNQVAPAIEAADAVVLAAPVYWFTFPGKIKLIIDKFYSFVVGKRPVAGKKCALIASCGNPDAAMLATVRQPYLQTAALLGWEPVGEAVIAGANALDAATHPDAVTEQTALTRAAALADLISGSAGPRELLTCASEPSGSLARAFGGQPATRNFSVSTGKVSKAG